MVLRSVVLVFVSSGQMYYSMIVSFPSLHVHVLDLKPFEVGFGHIGLTRHHGAELLQPFMLFILFQTPKRQKSKRRKTPQIQAHQRHASINNFIQLVTMNHIIIDVIFKQDNNFTMHRLVKNLLPKPMFLINMINKFTYIYCCIIWWPPNESFFSFSNFQMVNC